MARFADLSGMPIIRGGAFVPGATIEVFETGTTTAKSAWKDAGLAAAHPRPFFTTAEGVIPAFWTQGTNYRVRVTTPDGFVAVDLDGFPGDASSGGGAGGGTGTVIPTGAMMAFYETSPITGWVRLTTGGSIGSAASPATERANADCETLFTLLWNKDATLVVSGGRGASAAADWASNKSIALPDARFRDLRGLDNGAGRTTGATFGTGNGSTLGAVGGTSQELLSVGQIPSHQHGGSTSAVGNHQHTGSGSGGGSTGFAGGHTPSGAVGSGGSHSHSGTTDTQGNHNHTFNGTSGSAQGGSSIAAGFGGTFSTGDAGNHSHNLNINSVGDHTHGLSMNFVNDHQHSVSVSVTFTSDGAGAHSHSLTTDFAGGGGGHNNLPPFLLVTWFMKL